MQLNLTASVVVLLALFSQGVCSETIAGASYKDVCKKMEQEGITSRTQSGGNTDDIAAPVNPMIGHNGPPEEEQSYTPDDSVREDEEDDNRFFKEADWVMGRLGL